MAFKATDTFVVVYSAIPIAIRVAIVAQVTTRPQSVTTSLPDRCGALALEMLGRHRRFEADGARTSLAPHGGVGC